MINIFLSENKSFVHDEVYFLNIPDSSQGPSIVSRVFPDC